MAIKKLVVQEFETDVEETYVFKVGNKYSYFVDPETGKFYEPKPSFEVTGENLEELFNEVDLTKWEKVE